MAEKEDGGDPNDPDPKGPGETEGGVDLPGDPTPEMPDVPDPDPPAHFGGGKLGPNPTPY